MTVQELIDELKKHNPKAKVIIPNFVVDHLQAAGGFAATKVITQEAQAWDDPYDIFSLDPDEGPIEKVVLIFSHTHQSSFDNY